MTDDLIPGGYPAFLTELKERIRTAQGKAALAVIAVQPQESWLGLNAGT